MNYQHIFSRVVGAALSLMMLGLLFFTAYAAGPGPADAHQALPTATHCVVIEDDVTISILLATNPELSTVCRFNQTLLEQEAMADTSFANTVEVDAAGSLADNPELMVARRYAAMTEWNTSTFLAANPELMVARRYAATTD